MGIKTMNSHVRKIAPSIFMSSGRCAIRCRQSARAGARFTVIQQIKVIKAKFKDRELKKGAKSHWIKPDQTKSNRITPGEGMAFCNRRAHRLSPKPTMTQSRRLAFTTAALRRRAGLAPGELDT